MQLKSGFGVPVPRVPGFLVPSSQSSRVPGILSPESQVHILDYADVNLVCSVRRKGVCKSQSNIYGEAILWKQ